MIIKEQIESFHQFALRQIEAGFEDSMDDLYELWRIENLPPEELAESVAAVQEALAEMDHPDAWLDAEEHLAQLRAKYGFEGNS